MNSYEEPLSNVSNVLPYGCPRPTSLAHGYQTGAAFCEIAYAIDVNFGRSFRELADVETALNNVSRPIDVARENLRQAREGDESALEPFMKALAKGAQTCVDDLLLPGLRSHLETPAGSTWKNWGTVRYPCWYEPEPYAADFDALIAVLCGADERRNHSDPIASSEVLDTFRRFAPVVQHAFLIGYSDQTLYHPSMLGRAFVHAAAAALRLPSPGEFDDLSRTQFHACLETRLSRQHVVCPKAIRFDLDSGTLRLGDDVVSLCEAEVAVLELLSRWPPYEPRPSAKEIAKRLKNAAAPIVMSVANVRKAIGRIRTKLAEHPSVAEHICLPRNGDKKGYRLESFDVEFVVTNAAGVARKRELFGSARFHDAIGFLRALLPRSVRGVSVL